MLFEHYYHFPHTKTIMTNKIHKNWHLCSRKLTWKRVQISMEPTKRSNLGLVILTRWVHWLLILNRLRSPLSQQSPTTPPFPKIFSIQFQKPTRPTTPRPKISEIQLSTRLIGANPDGNSLQIHYLNKYESSQCRELDNGRLMGKFSAALLTREAWVWRIWLREREKGRWAECWWHVSTNI